MERPPPKKSTESLPNKILGTLGVKNWNGTPLSEYYPGTAHLGFQSAETLCFQITKIATGEMYLFTLLYTDSDCIVPENIHIFPREGFFGLNLPRHQKFFFTFTFLETMDVGVCKVVMDISLNYTIRITKTNV